MAALPGVLRDRILHLWSLTARDADPGFTFPDAVQEPGKPLLARLAALTTAAG
jgi:hypothetical protein